MPDLTGRELLVVLLGLVALAILFGLLLEWFLEDRHNKEGR